MKCKVTNSKKGLREECTPVSFVFRGDNCTRRTPSGDVRDHERTYALFSTCCLFDKANTIGDDNVKLCVMSDRFNVHEICR